MYYQKCNNCGHLNEVKTEYLVFCASCKKKLDNNFADWKRRNDDKGFEDYKKHYCISDTALQANVTSGSNKYFVLYVFLGIFVLLTIITSVMGYVYKDEIMYYVENTLVQRLGETIDKYKNPEKTNEEVLTKDWVTKSYGSYGLVVETPSEMDKTDIPLPDNLKQLIEKMDSYNYINAVGLKIVVNSVKYKAAIGELDIQGAANGSVSQMKMQNGVSDFNYTEEPVTNNTIDGIKQTGSFMQLRTWVEFTNVVFAKDLHLWQITVAYESADSVGRIAANRVIESIQIDLQ